MNSIALNAVIVLQNFADLLKSGGTLTFLVFDKKKVHILKILLLSLQNSFLKMKNGMKYLKIIFNYNVMILYHTN